MTRLSLFLLLTCAAGLHADAEKKPIKALMIAGGCCHDYPAQSKIVSEGVSARAHVTWEIVLRGKSRDLKVDKYLEKDWIAGYDVVLHNECYGGVKDVEFVESIVAAHTDHGVPALFLHCSAHSYRGAKTDAWRKLLGVSSYSHEKHRPVAVKRLNEEHPVMFGFPETWNTPNGELYKIEKLWPNTVPLAQAFGKDTGKDHVCIWVNQLGKSKVFGTTLGHHNETMQHDIYLDLVTRGLLWTLDLLEPTGEPKPGYEAKP